MAHHASETLVPETSKQPQKAMGKSPTTGENPSRQPEVRQRKVDAKKPVTNLPRNGPLDSGEYEVDESNVYSSNPDPSTPRYLTALQDGRRSLLIQVAHAAEVLLADHPNKESFHQFVKFAHHQNVVSADQLAEIGRADRTTASRWINGASAPSPLTQEAIIREIGNRAELMFQSGDR